MSKSPGFWFFTGDWLKDPELRFCSIFARGLLVDLLCYMFEAKEQGYLVWPDGTARTNREIAEAVSGGEMAEKLAAITELEKKGVLSRDYRGVLFSRRIARLGEISKTRQQNGSKGGSKRQANRVANEQQKSGVSVSVSDSVSDTFNTKPPKSPLGTSRLKGYQFNPDDIPARLCCDEFLEAWATWLTHRRELKKPVTKTQALKQLAELAELPPTKAVEMIDYTIARGWQGLRAPEPGSKKQKPTDILAELEELQRQCEMPRYE